MNRVPYIGIAGITSRDEIDAIVDGWPEDAPPLAMGVLASYKTAILRQPNRYPNRYPTAEQVRALWCDDGRVALTIHYSFADDDRTPPRTALQLVDELETVRELADSFLWLQVNARPMIRPWQAEALARVASQWSRIIVQVSGAAMKEGYAHMQMVLDRLANERDKVTLLFDASGGTGKPWEAEGMAERLIHFGNTLGWHCGMAGGLMPENIHRLRGLRTLFPPLAIDVESGVRDADDRLDIAKASAFMDAARELHR